MTFAETVRVPGGWLREALHGPVLPAQARQEPHGRILPRLGGPTVRQAESAPLEHLERILGDDELPGPDAPAPALAQPVRLVRLRLAEGPSGRLRRARAQALSRGRLTDGRPRAQQHGRGPRVHTVRVGRAVPHRR